MSTMQFVSCDDIKCPYNNAKTCHAREIAVGPNGLCLMRHRKINKSETENYVKVTECACSKCNNWEMNEAEQLGQCGLRENLFFCKSEKQDSPTCNELNKQIGEPGFFASL